jgi:hypothetical protein
MSLTERCVISFHDSSEARWSIAVEDVGLSGDEVDVRLGEGLQTLKQRLTSFEYLHILIAHLQMYDGVGVRGVNGDRRDKKAQESVSRHSQHLV